MKNSSVVFSSLYVQIKQTYARNMYRFCLLVSPLMSTILLAEMYRNSEHDNFTAYIVLGAGLMSLWGCICFSSAGDINRERYSNTLSLIFRLFNAVIICLKLNAKKNLIKTMKKDSF